MAGQPAEQTRSETTGTAPIHNVATATNSPDQLAGDPTRTHAQLAGKHTNTSAQLSSQSAQGCPTKLLHSLQQTSWDTGKAHSQ